MPSLEAARRIASVKNNGAKTIGQIHKENSDWLMDYTWDSDIQSKTCYIYDYYHDNQKDKNNHMTYENTTKTRIDAKFIIKSYQSIDKDQIEYYLQFRPSQPTEFQLEDELYYFETDYRQKYGNADFCGMYVDIPNDRGVYEKWIICEKERANQFPKYLILPCTYEFMWIEKNGSEIYKRRMWGAPRSQKSYTIGYYSDRTFTRPDNQQKAILPMNPITEELWYTDDEGKNMRLCISSYTKHPIVWNLSKCENMQPMGIQTLTFYQTVWNDSTDFIEKDDFGNIIGLWANYYTLSTESKDISDVIDGNTSEIFKIHTSNNTLKIGGSYKTLTLVKMNSAEELLDGDAITANWTCSIDDDNWTNKVIWRDSSKSNQTKLKFPLEQKMAGKILCVQCEIEYGTDTFYSLPLKLELII